MTQIISISNHPVDGYARAVHIDGSANEENKNRYIMAIRIVNSDNNDVMVKYGFFEAPNYAQMQTYLSENDEPVAIELLVSDMDWLNLFD